MLHGQRGRRGQSDTAIGIAQQRFQGSHCAVTAPNLGQGPGGCGTLPGDRRRQRFDQGRSRGGAPLDEMVPHVIADVRIVMIQQ
jgi:hypothetical protein